MPTLRYRPLLTCLSLIAAMLCGAAHHNRAAAQAPALITRNPSPAPELPHSSLLDLAHDTGDSIANQGS